MKKWMKKYILLLAVVLSTGLLCACSAGSTVETQLNINDDLSGERIMEVVIDQSVFDENFTGSIDDLSSVVQSNCPTELTWELDTSTGANVYRFHLTFTDVENYQSKVDTLMGDVEATISISTPDSVWATGLYLSENFTSSDLLNWLENAIVDAGMVSEDDRGYICEEGSAVVNYAGNSYDSGSTIYVDDITYLDIDSIDVLTKIQGHDTFDKMIVLTIPEYTMESNETEIKDWLSTMLPEGATGEWTTNDYADSVYTVSKNGMNGEEMQTFLRQYFGSDSCTVEVVDVAENTSPFSFMQQLNEIIDFSNYIVGDSVYYTDVNYLINGVKGYYCGSDIYYLNDGEVYDAGFEEYPGYQYGGSDYSDGILQNFTGVFQKVYKVKDISIESKVGIFGKLSREVVFTFEKEPSEEEVEIILERIQGLLEPQLDDAVLDSEVAEEVEDEETTDAKAETVEMDVDVKDKTKDGVFTITITQSGDAKNIAASTLALYGYEGMLLETKNYSFAKIKYGSGFYDEFMLGAFDDYVTEDCKINYIAKTGFLNDLEYVNHSDAKKDGNQIVYTTDPDGYISIMAYGNRLNIWAIGFWLMIVVAIVSVILVLKSMGVFQKLLAKKGTGAQPVIEGEARLVIETEPEVMFCENCGAKRDADALVCTECGTRFED